MPCAHAWDSLGKFDPSGINHILDVNEIGSCFCGPSYFEGADGLPPIVSSGNNGLMVWRINLTGPSIALAQEYGASEPLGTTYFQKGFFTSVSSNSHTPDSAVIWAIRRPQKDDQHQSLSLHAFDAKDGAHLCATDAGPWPMNHSNGAAPNAVPVVANGKVFIASYKELWIFGIGGAAACGAQIAAAPQHEFGAQVALEVPLPINGQFGVVRGTIINVAGSKLHLKWRNKTVDVDLSKVLKSGHHGNIDPGKPVTIRGIGADDGSILAESIYSGD